MSSYQIINNILYRINEDDSLIKIGPINSNHNISDELKKYLDKTCKKIKKTIIKKEVKTIANLPPIKPVEKPVTKRKKKVKDAV